MLKIIKAEEPILVERLNVCLYAPPGVGKTTLAQTADKPLTLDFDKGAHRAKNRGDVVPVNSWSDVESISAEDLAPYNTVVLDTAGRALDYLTAALIKENPKLGSGGALTLQGFGKLKSRFYAYLKMLNTFGKDVVEIAHMDEQRSGDEVIERLDVQGGSKGEIYKSADAMGRIFIKNNKRILDFSPRENSFGKNPANMDPLEIPHYGANPHFLADVIANIKADLNRLSEEQRLAKAVMDEWSDAIKDMRDVSDFNRNIDGIKKQPEAIRAMFNAAARNLGFTYRKETGLYEATNVLSIG